ncbi:MAG TPA: ATP-binding cassette domain-containing protein [Bryobacteraceae bacterium]|nr:ATP-binding cassette domain-containing protein [Bryobacteraceae bacterium]
MIAAQNLHKQFGSVVAVDNVSFVAPDGAVTGVLGPNGAGKTTSLRMVYGLLKPERGSVLIDGIDMASHTLAAQRRIGVLPDISGLYPRLTPREHIRYFGRLQGVPSAELDHRIDTWVRLLDLGSIIDRRVAGFSHGERTKVALARALVHNPGNILLDEPTNGLDVMSTRAVRELIRHLRAEGRCVVFSSHVMQEVSALCDRIVVMGRGKVVAEGTPEDLLTLTGCASLEDAFVHLVGPHGETA